MQLRHLADKAVSTGLQEPASSLSAALAAPEQQPPAGPDLRSVTASIGMLAYEWDIATDRLSWGENLREVLATFADVDLSTGRAYGERLGAQSATSRFDAIVTSAGRDDGHGVLYNAIYALAPPRETGGGSLVWIEDCGKWFAGRDGRPSRAHGVVRVITERHEMERRLTRSAQFDALTGAMSRALLAEHSLRLLGQPEKTRKPFTILLVALENLFALNRTYGYDAGDEIIVGLATRLRANVRVNDLVARYAGNKFAVLLENCDVEQAKASGQRLIEVIAHSPFATEIGVVSVSARIGAVVAPRDGRSPAVLFQHAEEALDAARQRNAQRLVCYATSLARDNGRLHALQISDSVVSALNERRVELAFQPIVDAQTGDTAFYEALLRVRLADGAIVVPGDILPIAEKSGLVRLLDQRVLELALARLRADPSLRISVNASVATLHDPEWPDWLANATHVYAGVADRLTIEITETTLIDDFDKTRQLICDCKRLGIKFAMDDFGAGHTSFRNLRLLDFDFVKIDGVFIQNIIKSEDDRFFVRTLTDLAKHLGLKIVAEWVEDEATARLLRGWGVDFFQGSLFGSAMMASAPGETLDLARRA
ncbi:putative bifunctional diguanylate cyclase/phosphodiesterase [Methylosinus sporium]|uniref:GGDEF-domain containing protein n=2 Tax=Methylosinus sporium TaxID=428 RepID=A0A2U1SQW9_METSR|nr:bifunctional diguanylate cyclase/phosphodiesterase [Methylosinus sporium]PWB94006.1 GGDEF-domain containing protein [Methylosinus sporium]